MSPTRSLATSLTPVMMYPTSPVASPSVFIMSGERKPISSISARVPVCIARIVSPVRNDPSTTRT